MKLYKDQHIVITGAAGFIGSCVVKVLNDRGFTNLILVDDFGSGESWKNLVGKQYQEMIGIDSLFSWFEGKESAVEAILHLGACSSTVETNASFLFENNYRYSVQLAEIAVKSGIRFIYASSAATYGDGSQGFSDDHKHLSSLRPLNMYGYSKQMFDEWLKNSDLLDRVTGLKYFNVYGPNEFHKGRMASAITHFVRQIEEHGEVRLFKSNDKDRYTDGGQMRDFIYVKDAAKWTCDLLTLEAFGIYNVGTGSPRTWNDLAKAVFKGLDRQVRLSYVEMPTDLQGKYQNYTCADMGKLRSAFGGNLSITPFEEAVVEYVKEYLVPRHTW